MRLRGASLAIAAAVGLAAVTTLPSQEPDPSSADSLDRKLRLIRQRHAEGAEDPKRFRVSEEEANAYLVYRVSEHLPEEVTAPWVRFDQDRVQVGAMLEMSLLSTYLSDSSPTKYLEGQVPIEVQARVQAEDGLGRVDLESVTLSGLPLPKTLLQKLVTHHSKSPSMPNGVRLDDPFPLPYGIVSARVRTGKLILRQGATQGENETRPGPSGR